MIGLVRNEWKKVFLPVLLTTVLLAIAMSVLSCTIYQNYVLHYDLEAWEVGTELFSLLYPLFVVVPLQENIELGGQNMSSYIEVKNVSKSFSGRAILQNISLPVEQGTTVGLVGANGSGKSVLFKIICGFEKPDQGSVAEPLMALSGN